MYFHYNYYLAFYFGCLFSTCRSIFLNKMLCSMQGVVGRNNFTYYNIQYHGNIVFNLQSMEGDADLYLSHNNIIPTYDPKTYDSHSATCGDDTIAVSAASGDTPKSKSSFKRIIAGVYGYSSNECSRYLLNIFENVPEDGVDSFAFCEVLDLASSKEKPETTVENEKKLKKNKNKTSSITSVFSLLEILQLIFT